MKIYLVCHMYDLHWYNSGYGKAILGTGHKEILESFPYLEGLVGMFDKHEPGKRPAALKGSKATKPIGAQGKAKKKPAKAVLQRPITKPTKEQP